MDGYAFHAHAINTQAHEEVTSLDQNWTPVHPYYGDHHN